MGVALILVAPTHEACRQQDSLVASRNIGSKLLTSIFEGEKVCLKKNSKPAAALALTSGTICTDTNLYKCTDNKVEYIEHIAAGTPFPNFPGGNGKGNATWFQAHLSN